MGNQDRSEERPFWEDFGLERAVALAVSKIATYLCLVDRAVPLLLSHTSQGKTAMIEQFAHAMEFQSVQYINMIGLEPTDLTGLPFFNEDGKTFKYLSDGRIPVGDNEDKVLVFLDEVNRCEPATVNAVFNFLNRQMGPHRLGKNVYVVMAANPANSTYVVASQLTSDPALLRRVVVIPVARTVNEFMTFIRNPGAAFKMNLPILGKDTEPPEFVPEFSDELTEEEWARKKMLGEKYGEWWDATDGGEEIYLERGIRLSDFMSDSEAAEYHALRQRAHRMEIEATPPWNEKVTEFLTSFPDCIETMNERDSGRVFATSAGWDRLQMLESTLDRLKINRHDIVNQSAIRAIIDGTVGCQLSERYRQFVENPAFMLTPKQLLYEFEEGSKAEEVIKDLTENGRDSQVIQLLEGVALFIANEAPAISEIAPSLSRLMLSLNPHTWSAFSESLAKAIRAAPNVPAAYAIKLHSEMQKDPDVMRAIHNKFEEREVLRNGRRS